MRQQFKVLAGKAKRSGRLQEVALFDEAGNPMPRINRKAFIDVQIHSNGIGNSVPTEHYDLDRTILSIPFFISMFDYLSAGAHVGPTILYRNPENDQTLYPNDFDVWCFNPDFQVARADGTAIFTAHNDGYVLIPEELNSYDMSGIPWVTPTDLIGSDLSHDDPYNRVVTQNGGLILAQFSGFLRVTLKNDE